MFVILDRLMLSSLSEANDPFFLEQNEIEAILYFGEGGMFSEEYRLYSRKHNDRELDSEDLKDGITFLKESLSKGRRVLAVGETGATLIVAYLIEMGFGSAQALQMVRDSSSSAPKPNLNAIRLYEQLLEDRRNSRITF
jgi:hypothetical protein